jgi:pimeloyl-ACP methyl ester carboxylesterase
MIQPPIFRRRRPVRDTDQPWEPHATADASYALFRKERRAVADDGTPIAYTHRNPDGPAVPVIFANGWSCSDAYWGKLLPELQRRGHPCLLPDTRGHGRSGLPRDPGRGARNLTVDDVSMNRIGRDLLAVLDDAGVDRAMVVGHSMGVQTALEVYRQAPGRILGLVLIAGTAENPAKTFYGRSVVDRVFPVGAAVMRWLPEVLAPVWLTIGPAGVGHFSARLAKAAGPKATAEDLHPYLLHLKTTDPAVMVLTAGAMRAHSAVDLLASIAAPVLVIAAGADVFTPARCSEDLHHRIPDSELVTFPEAGHTIPVEEPEAIGRAIDDFVARRVAPVHAAHVSTANQPATTKPAAKKPAAKKPAAKKTTGKTAAATTKRATGKARTAKGNGGR